MNKQLVLNTKTIKTKNNTNNKTKTTDNFKHANILEINNAKKEEKIDTNKEENIEETSNKENIVELKEILPMFESRDESWLKFNKRIIELAKDKSIPLLERFNYLSISSSNLDEFTMVRYPNILNNNEKDEPVKSNIKRVNTEMYNMLDEQSRLLKSLLIELKSSAGIELVSDKSELEEFSKNKLLKYFNDKVLPLLTPLIVDKVRPFPLISNNTIYIGVIIKDNSKKVFGIVQVPDLPRLIPVPCTDKSKKYILLEDLIKMHLSSIFINKEIHKLCVFRILRNTNYSFNDKKQKVFIADEMKEVLKRNKANDVVRLDISGNKKDFSSILYKALKIKKNCINKTDEQTVDMTFGFDFKDIKLSKEEKEKLQYPKFKSRLGIDDSDEFNIFNKIDDEDILLHHPYDSYDTVIEFIKQAAKDKDVVAIKQTLYRVTSSSPIVKALIKAAENGKKVTVLLEVKARFDEVNNLKWANKLEKAGVYVVYGVPNMKTHCKMCLVVKKNKKKLKKYVHICTGNYSEKNAKLYTDISLFTSNSRITNDINNLFNYITGFSEPDLQYVKYSPISLKQMLIDNIDNEIRNKKEGKEAEIIFKVNSLTYKPIINKLYEARDAGVNITLIVRSACSLIDTKGITVKSVVGRFLEHSRIFYFYNGYANTNKYYISSSDIMNRNLEKRVEIAVPILHTDCRFKMKDILNTYLNDENCFTSVSGTYFRGKKKETDCQEIFMKNTNNNEFVNNIIFTRQEEEIDNKEEE